jgi:hypothetical protein
MLAFRAADRQVGGGHLYATVTRYLHTEVGPRIFGAVDGHESASPFGAAAALTEMAGWMAHDAGRDHLARRHLDRARRLASASGDPVLVAHVLGSESHLAHHQGRAADGVGLARDGAEHLASGPRHGPTEARLLALQARGHASLGDRRECLRLLGLAESVLRSGPGTAASPWVNRFDEGSLASETARCMRDLGDRSEEGRQAGRILDLRRDAGSRSRVLGQLVMVGVLIAQSRVDEACGLARDALESTRSLGSFVVIERLMDLRALLAAYGTSHAVQEFLASLDEARRERAWLIEWLVPNGDDDGR